MTSVTPDEGKAAMIMAGIERVEHHECSFCDYPTAYLRHADRLMFDAGCHCTGTYRTEPRSWAEAAEWVNMQTDPAVRERLMAAFGLPPPGSPF